MELELDEQEKKVLLDVLQARLPDLRQQIGWTENFDWRQEMKQDEAVLKRLIERVARLAPAATL